MKILNDENLKQGLIGKVRNAKVYSGNIRDAFGNPKVLTSESYVIKAGNWKNSEGRAKLLNERKAFGEKFKNAATGYDEATIAAYKQNLIIDLQRTTDDLAVYTPMLVSEILDESATENVALRNYMPYVGREGANMGASDAVPLMEHNLPIDNILKVMIKAFGDKTTLRELFLNPFYKTENVINSAARILADGQNADFFKPIIDATYDAAHTQTLDTTGATPDIQIYNTIKKAINKALRLYNPAINKKMGLMNYQLFLLVNPIDLPDIEPIINGSLERLSGVNQLLGRLPINNVIAYGGGVNDGLTWANETLSFPGIEAGTFYIYIRNDVYGAYKIIKRAPTMEMGTGSPLMLATEERAWHRIDGIFLDWILPSGTTQKPAGAIIKGALA
jgi:hypothetical protein